MDNGSGLVEGLANVQNRGTWPAQLWVSQVLFGIDSPTHWNQTLRSRLGLPSPRQKRSLPLTSSAFSLPYKSCIPSEVPRMIHSSSTWVTNHHWFVGCQGCISKYVRLLQNGLGPRNHTWHGCWICWVFGLRNAKNSSPTNKEQRAIKLIQVSYWVLQQKMV